MPRHLLCSLCFKVYVLFGLKFERVMSSLFNNRIQFLQTCSITYRPNIVKKGEEVYKICNFFILLIFYHCIIFFCELLPKRYLKKKNKFWFHNCFGQRMNRNENQINYTFSLTFISTTRDQSNVPIKTIIKRL